MNFKIGDNVIFNCKMLSVNDKHLISRGLKNNKKINDEQTIIKIDCEDIYLSDYNSCIYYRFLLPSIKKIAPLGYNICECGIITKNKKCCDCSTNNSI